MSRRFFVDKENIDKNFVVLTGKEHFHFTKVLRGQIEDELTLTTSANEELCVKVVKITKEKTICEILSKAKIEDEQSNVFVFQALMKGEHMDYAIQKCTELGVREITPFQSEFVVAKMDSNKLDRFKRISQEACKQSGRATIIQINQACSFDRMLEKLKDFSQIVVAYEKENLSAKEVIEKLDKNQQTALVIGSEGGFSGAEIEKLKNLGAKTISLGKNILRGETACLALVSAVMMHFDYWRK